MGTVDRACCDCAHPSQGSKDQNIHMKVAYSVSAADEDSTATNCTSAHHPMNCHGNKTILECAVRPQTPFTSIKQFYHISELYKGSVSTVFKAAETATGRPLVIKAYHKAKMQEKHLHKLSREVDAMKAMQGEYVVTLYATFQDTEAVYLVQEYCEGGDLFKRMMMLGGRMEARYVCVEIITPLLLVLEKLHSLQLVHRDIKPENIFLTAAAAGAMRLGDFGLALNHTRELAFSRSGTLDYMAPEVLRNPATSLQESPAVTREQLQVKRITPYSAAVDVWAAGVLAYELVVGRPPFEVKDEVQTAQLIMYSDAVRFPQQSDPAWMDFVRQALTKDPRVRPSATQLLHHAWIVNNMRHSNSHSHAHNHTVGVRQMTRGSSLTIPAHHSSDAAAGVQQLHKRSQSVALPPLPAAAAAAVAMANHVSTSGAIAEVVVIPNSRPSPHTATTATTATSSSSGAHTTSTSGAVVMPDKCTESRSLGSVAIQAPREVSGGGDSSASAAAAAPGLLSPASQLPLSPRAKDVLRAALAAQRDNAPDTPDDASHSTTHVQGLFTPPRQAGYLPILAEAMSTGQAPFTAPQASRNTMHAAGQVGGGPTANHVSAAHHASRSLLHSFIHSCNEDGTCAVGTAASAGKELGSASSATSGGRVPADVLAAMGSLPMRPQSALPGPSAAAAGGAVTGGRSSSGARHQHTPLSRGGSLSAAVAASLALPGSSSSTSMPNWIQDAVTITKAHPSKDKDNQRHHDTSLHGMSQWEEAQEGNLSAEGKSKGASDGGAEQSGYRALDRPMGHSIGPEHVSCAQLLQGLFDLHVGAAGNAESAYSAGYSKLTSEPAPLHAQGPSQLGGARLQKTAVPRLQLFSAAGGATDAGDTDAGRGASMVSQAPHEVVSGSVFGDSSSGNLHSAQSNLWSTSGLDMMLRGGSLDSRPDSGGDGPGAGVAMLEGMLNSVASPPGSSNSGSGGAYGYIHSSQTLTGGAGPGQHVGGSLHARERMGAADVQAMQTADISQYGAVATLQVRSSPSRAAASAATHPSGLQAGHGHGEAGPWGSQHHGVHAHHPQPHDSSTYFHHHDLHAPAGDFPSDGTLSPPLPHAYMHSIPAHHSRQPCSKGCSSLSLSMLGSIHDTHPATSPLGKAAPAAGVTHGSLRSKGGDMNLERPLFEPSQPMGKGHVLHAATLHGTAVHLNHLNNHHHHQQQAMSPQQRQDLLRGPLVLGSPVYSVECAGAGGEGMTDHDHGHAMESPRPAGPGIKERVKYHLQRQAVGPSGQ